MLLRASLRVLLFLIVLSIPLIFSGCTTPQLVQPHPAKPTTCLLPVPQSLSPLTAEYLKNAQERNSLAYDLNAHWDAMPPSQRDLETARLVALDKRQAQILIDLKADDGEAYATAITELADCQSWIRRQ